MYQYDTAVIIGRFQPFHNGHKHLIEEALKIAQNVLVLVGSANKAISIKNPFSFQERQQMITFVVCQEIMDGKKDYNAQCNRVKILPIKDFTYNDEMWVRNVQATVDMSTIKREPKIVLVGHEKDESSFYLKMFPQWTVVDAGFADQLNATDMRNLLFDKKSIKYLKGVVPNAVYNFIENRYLEDANFKHLKEEFEFIQKYKKAWEAAPYAPTFYTADAVVIQQGHVLLIKRGAMPGKDQWALPGGFVNQNEFTKDACIRELREETKLKVPDPVLRGSLVAEKIFDAPSRSLRGRTITMAYLFHLTNYEQGLPKVKAGDDAKKGSAKWVPLADLKEEEFFEDHYMIIQYMLGKL